MIEASTQPDEFCTGIESADSDSSDEIRSFGSSGYDPEPEAAEESLPDVPSDEICDWSPNPSPAHTGQGLRSEQQDQEDIQNVASWEFVTPTKNKTSTPESSRQRLPLVPYDPKAVERSVATSKGADPPSEVVSQADTAPGTQHMLITARD